MAKMFLDIGNLWTDTMYVDQLWSTLHTHTLRLADIILLVNTRLEGGGEWPLNGTVLRVLDCYVQ